MYKTGSSTLCANGLQVIFWLENTGYLLLEDHSNAKVEFGEM